MKETQKMDCSVCGTPLAAGIQFCPNCGAAVANPTPPPPAAAAPIVIPGQVSISQGQPAPLSSTNATSTLSVVSLVAGITSWILAPCVGGIVAIVTGHMARGEIVRSGGRMGGDGLALAGLIIGYANVALSCLAMALFSYFFSELARH